MGGKVEQALQGTYWFTKLSPLVVVPLLWLSVPLASLVSAIDQPFLSNSRNTMIRLDPAGGGGEKVSSPAVSLSWFLFPML